ncbi:cysteine proteinase [Myxozyma melibiosi]|uniref:ubiquitinyl hydrolase 1 n=1 Tax=Myxozyma melibiosi TaxID=54550 RepID=A0ABR1FB08_9ASCO
MDPQTQPVRADDEQAMRDKAYPPLDDLEVDCESMSVWKIESWKKLDKRLHSPAFDLGGFSWKLLLFPAGNQGNSLNQIENVSLYIECSPPVADSDTDMADSDAGQWAVCAQFGLVMANHRDPSVFTLHQASHRFTPEEKDWGFTKFYELRKLVQKVDGKDLPILEDDKVDIYAYVRIIKDPTGVLWHNFINYDSKKETGYVGLRNQGATCYMNSLLQSLYFTSIFRRAVYQIPTATDEPTASVPLALQRAFYLLQSSPAPVGTNELTRSFGWDTSEAFTQHDVQEFNRVLMDNLEGKMKGTAVENALTDIFVGQMKSFVKCINVDFESSRSEDFWDIQLNVKGMKDLHESFKDYIQVETLNGENQYQATGYGLQDAEKGVIFQSFPPVLHLQLKRFEYDFNRDMMVKINDRHEFPLEIDLSEFLEPQTDRSEPWVYVLHGVLVHSGDLNAGHYYALLKPEKEGDWYKFDDDRVTRATLKEVLDENYGEDLKDSNNNSNTNGLVGHYPMRQFNKFSLKRHSNAYMLVYLRKSRVDNLLAPLKEEDTPQHISESLEREQREEEARRKEREEQHLFMHVLVMSTRQFVNYHGVDIGAWGLAGSDEPNNEVAPEARPMLFKVRKTSTLRELRDQIAKDLAIENPAALRFWLMVSRQNKTIRPDLPLLDSVPRSLKEVRDKHSAQSMEMTLWMEEATTDPETGALIPCQAGGNASSAKILIFLKYFDHHSQSITGIGCVTVGKEDKLSVLYSYICKTMKWAPNTAIDLFEEISATMVDSLDSKKTFSGVEIQDGDIICFQKRLPESELATIHGCHDAKSYYDFLRNRIQILFKPRFAHMAIQEEFQLYLSLNDKYNQISAKVGKHLNVDPTHLRLCATHTSGALKAPIKASTSLSLKELLGPVYAQVLSHTMYYEVLDVALLELESMKALKLTWLTDGITSEHHYDILVPKNGTMVEVLQVLKQKAGLSDEVASRVRFYGANINKIHRQFPPDYSVLSILDSTQLYAEELPADEVERKDKEKLITAFHFQKEANRTHGIPFFFTLKPGEKFADTKARLQERTGIKDKQFEKIKFALVQRASYPKPLYLEDEMVVYDMAEKDDELGLDHLDKTTYKNLRHEQRAIFIKN